MSPPGSSSRPAYCPNPRCDSRTKSTPWRYKKKGFFFRDQKPRRVQRYLCHHCGRNFSSQTFDVSYWLRHGHLLEPLFKRLVSCSGLRQIAREMEVSHSTVQRLTERLGRHCLLFHERMRPRTAPAEPLVLDGFRTFEHSQYWPMDLNLLVGASHYVYGFNDAELRRSGTMRPSQRLKRAMLENRHGRPDPRATRRQVEELLRRVVPPGGAAVIRSDEHQAYPQAMGRLRDRTFHHEPTPSTAARTTQNCEPQAGDDRVFEAETGCAVSSRDLGRVEELHQEPVGKPAGCSACEEVGIDPACADRAPGARESPVTEPGEDLGVARSVLFRSDSDPCDRRLPGASGEVRGLVLSISPKWPSCKGFRFAWTHFSVHVSTREDDFGVRVSTRNRQTPVPLGFGAEFLHQPIDHRANLRRNVSARRVDGEKIRLVPGVLRE